MYNYTPIGIYAAKAWEDEKREDTTIRNNIDDTFFINTTELNTVKTLFQIRNANFYKKQIVNDYSISFVPKERVFIAGKIFPIINLIFKETSKFYNCTKIELRNWKKSNDPVYDSKIHNRQYISVDNDNLIILLPISYSGINFPELMLDFLTNGQKTKHTIGGEFPDYSTYKFALREKAIDIKKWKGQDGCWLTKHRAENSYEWRNGYSYIIEHKIKGRLGPFAQIYHFYQGAEWNIKNRFKHEVKWCRGAKALVEALAKSLEEGNAALANDVETILNELNLGICDFAVEKFHELMYGKYAKTPLKGDAAYEWDKSFIEHEQGVVAPPIYKKTSRLTISKFQDMADKNPAGGWHGLGAYFISLIDDIIPAFNSFDPKAKVTDDQFRIDLPLLMLYLHKHSPKWFGFKNKLNPDGTVNAEIVKIIQPYEK